jgi:gamma-glutamylcyclotransferase (GGCT)/AIG2-like uncharacterized protein YtfP
MIQQLLFVYGTLKDSRVQRSVIGRVDGGIADTLAGYTLTDIQVGQFAYPFIVADENGSVDGLVLAVNDKELARIDRYETSAYRRIEIRLLSGKQAWVYCQ